MASLLGLSPDAGRARDKSDVTEKMFPQQIGEFRALAAPAMRPLRISQGTPDDFQVVSYGEREYAAPGGGRHVVTLVKTKSTMAAYALLRYPGDIGRPAPYNFGMDGDLGVVGLAGPLVKFISGSTVVWVAAVGEQGGDRQAALSFAKQFAETLQGEPGSIPPLVLHLPDWEKKHPNPGSVGVGYAVSLPVLQTLVGPSGRTVLDAVPFDSGVEAATAAYEGGRLVVVEFPTPQHAFDADAAVNGRITELRATGQPVPSAYKRVGNYAVFVFDAPDAGAAEKLVSGVKYEKDVRWLGRDPHAEEKAVRAYTSTMGGVFLTTLITSGVTILVCLGIGGLIGGAVFLRRRARIAEQEVYSDAGGMVRLNIEDLNTPPPAAKLLRRAED